MDLKPIYTEPENCQDCYKCVRECPVKAIQIEDNKAYIIEERCIYCGHCTQVCPTGAKKIRDGVSRTRLILQNYPRVILSLAPSWACEFEDLSIGQPSANLVFQEYPRLRSVQNWSLHGYRIIYNNRNRECISLPPVR